MKALFASVVFLAALSTAWGCHRSELRVELPAGYSGHVSIFCATSTPPPSTVAVNSSGTGIGAPCDAPTDHLLVVRNGQRISPEGSVRWLKTGDGIATGLEFTVR